MKAVKVLDGIWTIVLANKQRDFLFMIVTSLRQALTTSTYTYLS